MNTFKPIGLDELSQLRNQTKGCSSLIHLNNAGSSLPPDIVVETVIDFLKEEALLGGYEAEQKHSAQIDQVYSLIARLINAEKEEVAILQNASAAWNIAFKGLAFEPGDEVITSELEFSSNLIGLIDGQKTKGIHLKVIKNDSNGLFPLSELDRLITPKTKLIAVTHIASSGGGMLPIAEIGRIASAHGILYLVDACQSVGQWPIDVKEIKCDILSATGRKFLRAPRGTGFLYVKKAVQDRLSPLMIDQHATISLSPDSYSLRADARRYELYESSRALSLGLGKAVEYALSIGLDRIWQRIQQLAAFARKELSTIKGLHLHDVGDEQCGIVTFTLAGYESLEVKNKLFEAGINVSYGGAVATPIYMEKYGLKDLVRASIHYYNTEEEVLQLCETLRNAFQAE